MHAVHGIQQGLTSQTKRRRGHRRVHSRRECSRSAGRDGSAPTASRADQFYIEPKKAMHDCFVGRQTGCLPRA